MSLDGGVQRVQQPFFLKVGLGFGIGLRMNLSSLLLGEAKALKRAPNA